MKQMSLRSLYTNWRYGPERLVHRFEWECKVGNTKGKVFVNLFERANGKKRRYTVGTTFRDIDESITHLDMYHEKVYPWLCGRYVPGIPAFSDIDALEVQEKLSQP